MRKHFCTLSAAMLALILALPASSFAGGPVKGGVSGSVNQAATEAQKGFVPMREKTSTAYTFTGPLTHVYQKLEPTFAPTHSGSTTDLPTIYGNVIWSKDQSFQTGAMYKIPLTPLENLTYVGGDGTINANRGGVEVGNRYMEHHAETNTFGVITSMYVRKLDTTFWDQKAKSSTVKVSTMATDLAIDPVSNTVYGCFYNDDQTGYVLGTMNYSTYKRTVIADLEIGWNACAIDAEGQLYAIDMNGTLVKVDKATGEVTAVGATGVTPKYLSSGCIDPVSGRMFWAASPADETGKLYEIDLTTGAATLICHFPGNEEIVGMHIPTPLAEDAAPAAVDNLTAEFINGSLEGNIIFDAPTTTFKGEELTGELTYTILNKTTKIAEGTTTCGAHTTVPVTISKAAKCEFYVTVANSVGSSPQQRVLMYVGKDKPFTPEVSSVYADGKFTVSWNAITEGVNGGYVNADAMTYKVVRYPDKTVIAEATSETSITDEVAAPETEYVPYYYTVTAIYDGTSSDAGQSNTIGLGQMAPPYLEEFPNSAALSTFTIIDNNNDGKTWGYSSGKARVRENSSMNMDDWLITPPLKLEKDKIYKFSMDLTTAKSYTECFEACYGKANTVDGMTEQLFEVQEINAGDGKKFVGYVKAKEDGLYYVGIHGMSRKNQFYIDIDNINLEEGTTALIPDAPTGFAIAPDQNGALTAVLTFNAPEKNLLGDALASLDKVEIIRDGAVIETKTQPAVGSAISFTDETAPAGKHIYSVVGYNEHGRGWEAVDSAYVGVNIPAAATNVVAKETANVGEVTVTWTVPATDVDGFKINPALVKYDVVSICGETVSVVAENLEANTFTYREVEADTPQDFYYYQVNAKTATGSTPALSASIPVGKADVAPYMESFADGTLSHAMDGAPVVGDANWALFTDTNDLGVVSADNDNGFAASNGPHGADEASLFTGKIDLSASTSPILTFYAYNIPNSDGSLKDRNKIEVFVNEGGVEKSMGEYQMNELGDVAGWLKVRVKLTQYAGKTVQIKWNSKVASFANTLIDNIRLTEYYDYNLAATEISAPKKIDANTDFNVAVTVENVGAKKVNDYSVELYRDETLVATLPGVEVEPDASANVIFTTQLDVLSPESVTYHAVVKYDADMDKADNTSAETSVKVKLPKYPEATNLRGSSNAQDAIELVWDEPETESAPVSVTEGFENAESFAVNDVDDWTFLDVDASKTYGISGVAFPNSGNPMAYIVFDASLEGLGGEATDYAHAGAKSLASFCATSGQNDDWAISPRLYGLAQKVSFYAMTFDDEYTESFEFYYSTTGTSKDDFVKVGDTKEVPTEWTKFEFDLPEGSRYFAIRCVSKDKFIFLVDDVTFIPAAPGEGLSLLGYNVYRDGVKLNANVIDEPSYTDATATGYHTYKVTVVYDKGESAPSNSVNIATSAIDDVEMSASNVRVEGHTIIVEGAEGLSVSIVSVDGKVLYSTASANDTVIYDALQGIYVVAVGDKAEKVIVK
ncbi:MAG: choice-of-anchor J domain-containing protein [Muribaculum sp.]|nr:choice-of-anchor J domain-containing protein [Muribaculum sp.]